MYSRETCDEKLHVAIEALIYLMGSRDDLQRRTARRSLVAMGECAVPALIDSLKSKAKEIRWQAAKGLVEIGSPSSASALVEALEDSEFGVRWLAAEGLINLGLKGVPPLLYALMRNPDSGWLREGAHHVLRVLMDKTHRDVLAPMVHMLENYAMVADLVPTARDLLEKLEAVDIVDVEDQSSSLQ
ncbi:MAG: HEAT repeat domain-containing protein [Armatimonadota bacterium]|nr:HEAT repeat domain-containing protein [bacterium]